MGGIPGGVIGDVLGAYCPAAACIAARAAEACRLGACCEAVACAVVPVIVEVTDASEVGIVDSMFK